MALSREELEQLRWLMRYEELEHPTRPDQEDFVFDDAQRCPNCGKMQTSVASNNAEGYRAGLGWNKVAVLPYVDTARICSNCQLCVIESREIRLDYASVAPRAFGDGGDGHKKQQAGCYGYDQLLRANPMLRDPKDPNQRIYHYQPYHRKYHFNERIKLRNNNEPRIPLYPLLVIRRLVLAKLALVFMPDDITADLVQSACHAITGLYPYAERWLQIRYFILTGRRANEPGATSMHDIPLLTVRQADQLGFYFQRVSQAFDEIFYRSSKNKTVKDNVWGKPNEEQQFARHNMMQYNYVFHQGTLSCFGVEEYIRLRTEFCFPLHKTAATLGKLNTMHALICERIGEACHQLPLTSQPISYAELEDELERLLCATSRVDDDGTGQRTDQLAHRRYRGLDVSCGRANKRPRTDGLHGGAVCGGGRSDP